MDTRSHLGVLHYETHRDFASWQHVRSGVGRFLEKQETKGSVLLIYTLAVLGAILFSVHRMLENLAMQGPAPLFSVPPIL
jgi:hypothetical protein